jgi:tRNA acetyltransferase TAN1
LFRKDPELRIVKTPYPGVLIAYSKILTPGKAYRIVVFKEYGFVENIIPVQCTGRIEEFDRFLQCIEGLVQGLREVKLKLRVRGVRGYSEALWSSLKTFLTERSVEHSPKSPTCLFIETIDLNLYGGLGYCEPVFKYRVE